MRYRKIDPRIWRDEKFRKLSPDEKLIALYILTAQSNRIGLFYVSLAMAEEEIGNVPETFPKRMVNVPETFQKRFQRVCEALNWGFDEVSRTVWIPKWWQYNYPENRNNLVGNLSDIHEVPETPFFDAFWANKSMFSGEMLIAFEREHNRFLETFQKHFGNVPETFPKCMATQEQEQEQEQDLAPSLRSGACAATETASIATPPVGKNGKTKVITSGSASSQPVNDPVVATFDCTGPVTTWLLHQSLIDEWQDQFKILDVATEMIKAHVWVTADPKRRKTARGMRRFLSDWLIRAVDYAKRNKVEQVNKAAEPKSVVPDRVVIMPTEKPMTDEEIENALLEA